MPINITRRNEEEPSPRVMTGLYSFDWALASRQGIAGFPMKSIVEITGGQGVGKTTVGLSLCGMIAKQYNHDFTLIDFERQNEETLSNCLECAGFSGNVDWVTYYQDKKGELTPEKILDVSTQKCYQDNPDVVLIDSLGAFTPTAVHEGELGAANMGRKAKVLSDWFTRTLRPILSNKGSPTVVMFTNHQHPRFDVQKKSVNMPTPMQSSGGVGVGYYATQSFVLKKLFGFDHINFGGYTLEGKVQKNRDGFGIESKKVFYLYVMAGEGVSKNLTAVIDCVMLNIATSSAKNITESATISIDGQKLGQFRDLIAERHNDSIFLPFHNALKAMKGGIQEVETTLGSE